MSITNQKKQELIKEYALTDKDTGSVEVQCAILTSRILSLTEHAKTHKHDFASKRGLLMLVGRRRRLTSYLKRIDESRYKDLIQRLGLRK